MFKSKTVFVVGAGASREVGLPIGSELKNIIAGKLNIKYNLNGHDLKSGDKPIADSLLRHARSSANEYLEECWAISEALPQAISIDHLLDAHEGNSKLELCGKLAIVQAILEAEAGCTLYVNPLQQLAHFTPAKLMDSWYEPFFNLLTEGVRLADIRSIFDHISFVVFNYDRCVEHFLYHSLQNFYRIRAEDAARLIETLYISHPYGAVGKLPWQECKDNEKVPFGATRPPQGLVQIAGQIKTFTERVEDEASRDTIRVLIQTADTVVFLGFAFHPMNMELITPETSSESRRVFGTGFGISNDDINVVSHEIANMLRKAGPTAIDLYMNLRNNLRCADLLNEFRITLTRQ